VRKLLCFNPTGLDICDQSVAQHVMANWDVTMVRSVEEALSLPGFSEFFVAVVIIGPDSRSWMPYGEFEALGATQLSLVALLAAETIRQTPVRELIANHFRDYHTLPVDSARLLATLGHAHGMAVLRARASSSTKGGSARQADLGRLVDYIQTLREAERSRIARDVHDELGQGLTAIKLKLLSILGRKPAIPSRPKTELDALVDVVDGVAKASQRIVTELRPAVLESLNLTEACHWLVERFERRSGLTCSCSCDELTVKVDDEQRTAVFRILQEALTNVARHARATECAVALGFCGSNLVLEVNDNGRGFDPSQRSQCQSLGLVSMQERASLLGGKLTIESRRQIGTRVEARFPLGFLSDEPDTVKRTACA